MLQGNIFNN